MKNRFPSLLNKIEMHAATLSSQNERWIEFWNGKRKRMVLADMGYAKAPFHMPRLLNLPEPGTFSRLRVLREPELYLEWQLETILHHLELHLEDDWIPNLWPWYGVGVLQSAFGCPIEWSEETDPWAHTRFYRIEEAAGLEKPDLTRNGLCATVLKTLDIWGELVDGKIPIRVTDVQSPLDVATQIVDYGEFIASMLTNPRAVHGILEIVTETLIEWIRLQEKRIENLWPGGWHYRIPPNYGIGVSDDALVVLSPGLYEEFVAPYCVRLSEAFGGILIHYCPSPTDGNPMHNLEGIQTIPGLRGIETRFAETDLSEAGGRIHPGTVLLTDRWEMPLSTLLDAFPERKMIVNLFEKTEGPEEAERIREWIGMVRNSDPSRTL